MNRSLLAQFPMALWSIWNRIGFYGRARLRWPNRPYREPAEPKDNLFLGRENASALEARGKTLLEKYTLHPFREYSTRLRYLESLTYLDFLEHLLPASLGEMPPTLRWMDVGAKNWAYVEGLYAMASHHHPNILLRGIELDGYRIYADLHSRRDYAMAYCAHLPSSRVCYEVGDVMTHREAYDVISCFLPFLFVEPCLRWGLPTEYCQPEAFLRHLVSLLRPGGWLLILNQGDVEAQEQRRLLEHLDPAEYQIDDVGPMPDSFLPYRFPRYGWRCRKRPAPLSTHSAEKAPALCIKP